MTSLLLDTASKQQEQQVTRGVGVQEQISQQHAHIDTQFLSSEKKVQTLD